MSSRSLNKVMLVGNLTRDPELKYTPSGAPVCSIGLATNRSWTTVEGQIKEEVQYHRITAWHKLAELTSKLLSKGSKVYMEGRIAYRSFTGKDGLQKSITEIILDDFIVFGGVKKIAGEASSPPSPEETGDHEENIDQPDTSSKKDKTETINPDDIPF